MESSQNFIQRRAVERPTTPAERTQHILATYRGRDLLAPAQELFAELAAAADNPRELVDLVEQLAAHANKHEAYGLVKLLVHVLINASLEKPTDEHMAWIDPLDAVAGACAHWLRRHPHEPELLNLAGYAAFELGDTKLARRLFEAVKFLNPDHPLLAQNMKAVQARLSSGAAQRLPAQLTPELATMRSELKKIAERAQHLPAPQRISLCMIVKDEQEMLPGCLDAVKDFVDEVIVVDTGSSDNTRELAAERGAQVFEFPWNGSFSDARNESLRHATGEWILWLDADEHLIEDDGPQLRELTRKPWLEGAYIVESHFTGEEEMGTESMHTPMRMWRANDAYRFEGIIHEQIMTEMPVWLPERFALTQVRVEHFGYLKHIAEDRSKRERNLELLFKQVQDNRTAFTCFNIGSEYGAMHDWAQARHWLNEAVAIAKRDDPEKWHKHQFAAIMVTRAAGARRECCLYSEAKALIEEGLNLWPDLTDLIFERALVALAERDFAGAADYAQQCLDRGDAPASYVSMRGRGSFQARVLLGAALRGQGRLDEARKQLAQALEEQPSFLPTIIDLADVMLARGEDPDQILAWFDGHAEGFTQKTAGNLLLAVALHEAGALDQAKLCYKRVLERTPSHSMARVALAEIALARQQWDEAINQGLGQIEAENIMASAGAKSAFVAAICAQDHRSRTRALVRIMASERLGVEEKSLISAWHRLLQAQQMQTPLTDVLEAEDLTELDDPVVRAHFMNYLHALGKMQAVDEFEQLMQLTPYVLADEQMRPILMAELYLALHFADMAADELVAHVQTHGPTAPALTGLGKVATMKEMWEEAQEMLSASLELDGDQPEAQRLLSLVSQRLEQG